MLRTKLRKIFPYINKQVVKEKKNQIDDEDPLNVDSLATTVRYKPECLDHLCQTTKFTKKELQIMYRGFKQECPSGIVKEDTFKEIYAQFFPQGDSNLYAHYVFNVFDQDRDGTVSFEEFVSGLSILARGDNHDKLLWAFSLYDLNRDGMITRDELFDIVISVYDLIGSCSEPVGDEVSTARDHVDRIFKKMDTDNDGVITIHEFIQACEKDDSISKSLNVFDTVL
ncbi:hypothetical protein HELRODRAFT_157196 [Helobdella robusta]|uniref:EF-hand domain-containing protein n=1 Tax=Helobdella robusta TaxID=6412 RepID=T1EM78_HELRO|nr:hypothetical protein HELRODRAFT_157196 [Helobdella robusta]ESO01607.1 hypothetical protein HELRODRAFT_157196 [Helobdella robusta]